ncbi:hypothetical protein [Desulfotruncus arcticus]|uniref:hypothetical protein n=1 Tax=Desulfotruncus arcticus TaxID=341036 RepID=UPI0013F4C2C1|nr:hypothetical protein [Desulfotruncus arcticus]
MKNKKTYDANDLMPQPDTRPGPGLKKIKNLEDEDTNPLAALNAEKDEKEEHI